MLGPYTMIGVQDTNLTTGAASEFSVTYAPVTIPGTFYGSNVINVPYGGEFGTPVTINDSVAVNTGGGTVTNVHLFVETSHDYQGDINMTLTSAAGTPFTVCLGTCRTGSLGFIPGVLELYGDATNSSTLTGPVTGLDAAFAGELADGNWTLTLSDNYPSLDDGILLSWGVYIN